MAKKYLTVTTTIVVHCDNEWDHEENLEVMFDAGDAEVEVIDQTTTIDDSK